MSHFQSVSPYKAGLSGKCPRCGEGALFRSFLGLKERCEACGLDYSEADSGDGPAVFIIFIVGFIAVAVAFVIRFVFYAPIFAAFLISSAISGALALALLRPMKATLIALQFRHKAQDGWAEEGRLEQ